MAVDKFKLEKNINNLKATIAMALAIDKQLEAEIEKARTLREQIISERKRRKKTPADLSVASLLERASPPFL